MIDNGRDFLLEAMPKDAICCEIGVWQGSFSERILSLTKPQKLFLIDPWVWDQGEINKHFYIANKKKVRSQSDMDYIYNSVVAKFSSQSGVIIHRIYSSGISVLFEDSYLDWAYIDGNHRVDNVKQDLILCFSKVKPSGFITGDDWDWKEGDCEHIKEAVQWFVKNYPVEYAMPIKNNQFVLRKK